MQKKLYIVIFIITFIIRALNVEAQYTDVVCAGDVRVYKINPKQGSTYTWVVTGGKITHEYADSIEVTWGDTGGDYDVQVVEKSRYGCLGYPVTAKVKISVPSINFGSDIIKICEGDSTLLKVGRYSSYLWNTGVKDSTLEVKTSGIYKVEVVDSFGCHMSDSVEISVVQKPKVDLGADITLCGDETVVLSASPNFDKYKWLYESTESTDSTLTAHDEKHPYVIAVQVWNSDGCTGGDTLGILPCEYKIPNTISPNDDGRNDTWKIDILRFFPNATVQIYDRWGQLVHEAKHINDINNVWDGTSNGRKLPMDSYFYILDLKNGGSALTGTISIVR